MRYISDMPKSLSVRLAVILTGLVWLIAQNAMSLGLVMASLSGHTIEATQDHGSHVHLMLGHADSVGGTTHDVAADHSSDLACDNCSAGHHIDIKPADPATPDSKIKSQLLQLALVLTFVILFLAQPRTATPRPSWPQPHRNTLPLLRRSVVLRH